MVEYGNIDELDEYEESEFESPYIDIPSLANPGKMVTVYNVKPPMNGIEFASAKFRKPEPLIYPILSSGETLIIYAPAGVGKTYLALSIVGGLVNGESVFNDVWTVESPIPCLYIDGEMIERDMQERIMNLWSKIPPGFRYYNSLSNPESLVNLYNQEWRDTILNWCLESEIKVLILDNVTTLYFPDDKQNSAESWKVMQDFILLLRHHGIALILVDHKGKGEAQGPRGTSGKLDIAFTAIELRRPADYVEEHGARFEIHFAKHRTFHGKDAKPFEVWYDGNGGSVVNFDLAKPASVGKPSKAEELEATFKRIEERDGNVTLKTMLAETDVSEKTILRFFPQLSHKNESRRMYQEAIKRGEIITAEKIADELDISAKMVARFVPELKKPKNEPKKKNETETEKEAVVDRNY